MSKYGTPFTETEFALAVQSEDQDEMDRLAADMSDSEIRALWVLGQEISQAANHAMRDRR